VDTAVAALVDDAPDAAWAQVEPLITLGLHHEQQHQELILMDIKHAFSCNPLEPVFRPQTALAAYAPPPLGWVAFEGGLRRIGHEGEAFAFDNEAPRHKVWLEPFSLADRPASAGEFADFIADGGYQRPDLWLSDGWAAVQGNGWSAPLYWRRHAGGWSVYTLSGRRSLDPAEPVCHVSFYEADAYARWSGARLPTEAEWEVAAEGATAGAGFLDDGRLHPAPAAPNDASPRQMLGAVWEWTASAYLPYPGFKPAEGAVGEYNGKFMSGQMVLRGGACVTPRNHIRASYRNFFPPEARWAFSGVRLARDA
jgi:ergothioneine biosynthesis protein EgtB